MLNLVIIYLKMADLELKGFIVHFDLVDYTTSRGFYVILHMFAPLSIPCGGPYSCPFWEPMALLENQLHYN